MIIECRLNRPSQRLKTFCFLFSLFRLLFGLVVDVVDAQYENDARVHMHKKTKSRKSKKTNEVKVLCVREIVIKINEKSTWNSKCFLFSFDRQRSEETLPKNPKNNFRKWISLFGSCSFDRKQWTGQQQMQHYHHFISNSVLFLSSVFSAFWKYFFLVFFSCLVSPNRRFLRFPTQESLSHFLPHINSWIEKLKLKLFSVSL